VLESNPSSYPVASAPYSPWRDSGVPGRLRSGASWLVCAIPHLPAPECHQVSLPVGSGLRIGLPPYLGRLHLGTATDTFPVTTSRLNPTATEGDDRSDDDGEERGEQAVDAR
jgi:hypothetical protein